MTADPRTVIVVDQLCDVCGVPQINIHHQNFPELWVSGETPRLAAENLVIRLRGNLDAVSDPFHRQPLCDALADVQAFMASDVILQPCCTDVIDTLAAETTERAASPSILAKTALLEVRRLVLLKGRVVPTHQTQGEITVHCLEGRIAFTIREATHELVAGQLIVVAANEPHSLVGLEDSTVLVTKVLFARPSPP